MNTDPQRDATSKRLEIFFQGILYFAVLLLVMLMCINYTLPLYDRYRNKVEDSISTPSNTEDLPDAASERVVREAQRATDSADRLLSFLEGASVLVALALGAAAIFGFQNARDLRDKVDTGLAEKLSAFEEQLKNFEANSRNLREGIKTESEQAQATRLKQLTDSEERFKEYEGRMLSSASEVDAVIAKLRRYDPLLSRLTELENSLNQSINDVALLLQSYLEFSGNQNFEQAYLFASEVVNRDQPTALALYMAGWLEIHRISNDDINIIQKGIENIEKARLVVTAQGLTWHTLEAAYGVGLRRLALQASGDERMKNLFDARIILTKVLAQSPKLMDFNKESFWGPVGGISRDLGNIDKAIEEYQNALKVTPGSSYPLGNLATLYLEKASRDQNKVTLDRAVDYFKITIERAKAELIVNPHSYFQMMDVAMGLLMTATGTSDFAKAHKQLAETLNLQPNASSMEVSLRGWFRLLCFSPTEMETMPENIKLAITTMLHHADCILLQSWLQNWQDQVKNAAAHEKDMLPAMNFMIEAIKGVLVEKECS